MIIPFDDDINAFSCVFLNDRSEFLPCRNRISFHLNNLVAGYYPRFFRWAVWLDLSDYPIGRNALHESQNDKDDNRKDKIHHRTSKKLHRSLPDRFGSKLRSEERRVGKEWCTR